jgi:hypothetical protein
MRISFQTVREKKMKRKKNKKNATESNLFLENHTNLLLKE